MPHFYVKELKMTTLLRLYLECNKEIYGKWNGVSDKAKPAFHKVEMMLTKSDISLEDYTLTTFTDRLWVGKKLGYLPWTTFVSVKSLERYIKRLEAGAEVTTKPDNKWLLMEIAVGEAVIGLALNAIEPDNNSVEILAQVMPGYMGDCRRPIEEAAQLLSRKYQTPFGYYTDIADALIRRQREGLESGIQATCNRSNSRKFLVV